MRGDDLFLLSAALAFYGLVSVAPLVIVALWLTSLVVGPQEIREAAAQFAHFAPQSLGADRALERVADLGTRLGLVAVVTALWPATAYGSGLVRVLDRLGNDDHVRRLPGRRLRGRRMALLLVALVPVLVLASLLATYAGATVLGDDPVETAIGLVVALAFGFVSTAAVVAIVYKVFPHNPPDWPSTLRGTLVGAGGISVLSVAYVAYLRLGTNFERRYASDALAAVVLLGAWLFFSNVALLLGYKVARLGPPEP